jgi:hypothetical protein
MSYNPSLVDKKDQVRLKIGDVYPDQEFLSDQEIRFMLDANSQHVLRASSAACRAIAARFARNTDYRFSTLWQDQSQAYKHFMDLAGKLEQETDSSSTIVPVFTGSGKSSNIFAVGMMDNPEAYQSDAGFDEH